MNSKFLSHLLHSRIVELFPIIGDDRMWDSESIDDVPLDKVCVLCLCDRGEWLCLYLLGEVIDRHDNELGMCWSGGKWVD